MKLKIESMEILVELREYFEGEEEKRERLVNILYSNNATWRETQTRLETGS